MEVRLNYTDIQGNILAHSVEFGFFKARYLFFSINKVDNGRAFVRQLLPLITSAAVWLSEENTRATAVTTNVAFTYNGLKQLGLPVLSLQSFPDEFIVGMRGRRTILGDDGRSDPECWDKVWHEDIHVFVSIEAREDQALEQRYAQILAMAAEIGEIHLLDGHRTAVDGVTLPYQQASVLYEKGIPTAKEHFGYSDGISNPFFEGMPDDLGNVMGGGKKVRYGDPEQPSTWAPLQTGEFILGYQDEAQEYPVAPTPPLLAKNGSFMAYSKFHEYVGRFNAYLDTCGAVFPGGKEALAAKFVGRWRNGAPLTSFPNEADANAIALKRQLALAAINTAKTTDELVNARAAFKEINKKFTAFDYSKDIEGSRCPVGAHTRRANPRGSLEFGQDKAFNTPSALDDRRRMIRRGLPYGIAPDPASNNGDHGTIVMSICASIKRQFEFVFQQWLNYGNDFKLANDKDPILGNHDELNGVPQGRMVVQGDQDTAPYFLSQIPRFIETRGGDYFFIPSLTALNSIGEGIVDPT
ncbi:Dyp-type peroxidase [Arsenicibacter rosenii]|uniref:DyP dimeric alpha+beta barrel domain-containing protein n=1 Tax=Arsenicibacter rosenii TaxID=1750698 RepID=A0A1S2VJ81_9BACT|nr:hypothetical protein [Arsenicibacter rosenii]OIN58812.1 hypothetical protein BLX24_11295 [Arsenicibacter rosenii]